VAAETEEAAEQALDLIEVDYEEMEPLLNPLEAIKPDAPILHPDLLSYRGLPVPVEKLGNVFAYLKWGKGDIEAGFREADLIVENTFTTQVTHQSYLEPHACVVKADPSGGAEIWACSKTPFAVRTQLSNCIGVAKEKLVFHPTHIGGDFGGKGGFMDVPACYFLSLKSGQPVKMVMDYSEELLAGNPRHPSIIKVKTGVKRDGTIVAHHLDFIFDSGAYGSMKPAGYLIGASTCAGPYRIANCLIEERMVYTNKVPCGHMRAPGDPQGFFANESRWISWREGSAWTRRISSARTCSGMAMKRRRAVTSLTSEGWRRWKRRSLYQAIKSLSQKTSVVVLLFRNGVRAAAKETSSSRSMKRGRSKCLRRWSIRARVFLRSSSKSSARSLRSPRMKSSSSSSTAA
jgi:hypothetical protein